MKGCELCSQPARMYCDSDGASLCWDCDAKVHSANFLVAKHTRCLLCQVCQSSTPWTASGTDLGRTLSVCISCTRNKQVSNVAQHRLEVNDDDDDRSEGEEEATDSEEEERSDGDYVEVEDEDGENQVVPWSDSPTPPCTTASSSSQELSSGNVSSLKRRRLDTDISSEDETECSSSTFHSEIMSPPAGSQSYDVRNWSRSLQPPSKKLIRPERVLEEFTGKQNGH